MRLAGIIFLFSAGLWAQGDDRAGLLSKMDGRADAYGKLSRQIWEFSEVGYKEVKSAPGHHEKAPHGRAERGLRAPAVRRVTIEQPEPTDLRGHRRPCSITLSARASRTWQSR